MNTTYDVAVIGGGLAGLSSAILLANKGRKVVLFEQHSYPSHKVCGEYLSRESVPFLKRLGLPLDEMDLPSINKFVLRHASGKSLHTDLPLGGVGISRYLLDDLLCEQALKAGVVVLQETKVLDVAFLPKDDLHEISTPHGIFLSKTAIGSFGKRSLLDKKLNRKFISDPKPKESNFIGIKYHVKANLPSDTIELLLFKEGYCGISQIEEGRFCLCYLTTARQLQACGGKIDKLEQTVLSENKVLGNYLQDYPKYFEQALAIAQIEFGPKEQTFQHLLMAGDAAGMISPLSGNGMSMALHSGLLVYKSIESYFEQNKTRQQIELAYTKEWQKTFNKRLRYSRAFQYLFYNQNPAKHLISLADKWPFLAQQLIKTTHGKPF